MPKLTLILSSRKNLFIVTLTVIVITTLATVFLQSSRTSTVSKSEIDTAVNQAKFLFSQKKDKGEDFSSGPCLSNALMENWVVDIAHKPRLPIDDLPQNQCPAYLEGRAEHFVELDTNGNLIRAQ